MTLTVETSKLTTRDNPFDPFDQFDDWYRFDMDLGYSSMCLLARYLNLKESMTVREEIEENERAIDQLIINDPTDLYTKVKRTVTIDV